MKTKRFMSIILAFTLTAVLSVSSTFFYDTDNYLTGEYLVSASSEAEAKSIADSYGASFVRLSKNGFAVVNFENPVYLEDSSLFSKNHTYDTLGEITEYTPNDPQLSDQYSIDMMDCKYAWNFSKGSPDVTVAVIDTGFNINHEDFSQNISKLSCNIITGKTIEKYGASAIEDEDGHGTAMAGLISAKQNNSTGISGIAPEVTLLCIKIESPNGDIYLDDYIDAIYYAIENGADVISLSLGRDYSDGVDDDELSAITAANNADIAVVCAAGNESLSHCCYPAAYSSTIAVTSVDESYNFAKSYSNYGVDATVASPGTKILTLSKDGNYGYSTGTSPATAQVSGVIALMLSSGKYTNLNQIKTSLTNNAVNPLSTNFSKKYGYGIVNAYNCLADEFFSVEFDSRESTAVLPSYSLPYGAEVISPINSPVIYQKKFIGWYQDEECTVPWVFKGNEGATKITQDTVIYGKWIPTTSDIGDSDISSETSSTTSSTVSDTKTTTSTATTTVTTTTTYTTTATTTLPVESSISIITEPSVSGDLNSDNEINIIDVVLMRAFIVGNNDFNENQYILSDLNQDLTVDILDVVKLRYKIVNQ